MNTDPREWFEIEPSVWVNPLTGGRSEPAPCGWCGHMVVWPVDQDSHAWGWCMDEEAAIERSTDHHVRENKRRHYPKECIVEPVHPTTALVIRWNGTLEKEHVGEFSKALARSISEKYPEAEVTVRTYGTVGART